MTKIRIRKHIEIKYGNETAEKVKNGELEVFKNGVLISNLKEAKVDSDENYLTFKAPKTDVNPENPKPTQKKSTSKEKTTKSKPTQKKSTSKEKTTKSKPTQKKSTSKEKTTKSKPTRDVPDESGETSKSKILKTPKVMTVREFLMLTPTTAIEVGRIEAKAAKPTVGGEFVTLDTKVYVDFDRIVNSESVPLKFKVVRNAQAG